MKGERRILADFSSVRATSNMLNETKQFINEQALAHVRELYLDLLKKSLLDIVHSDPDSIAQQSLTVREAREDGRDWSERAHTMIGMKRLNNLQACVEDVLKRDILGDMIETGVWRGGSCIFMRGILKAHGVTDRKVWVADSFEGLPPPDTNQYPEDNGFDLSIHEELAVSLEQVRGNFTAYDLLDDQVQFLKGFFRDTLPTAPIEQISILRLDGDLYESTIQALDALYPKLASGGYVIVDDYGALPPCRQAIHDFRELHNITAPIYVIDWTGVYWRKGDSEEQSRGPVELGTAVPQTDIYSDTFFRELSQLWTKVAWERGIYYETTWLGVPVLQLSEDLMMMQELIYEIMPDIIIETGSFKGGTAVYYASLCELIGKGKVISIDIAPKQDEMSIKKRWGNRIQFLVGSSTDEKVIDAVKQLIKPHYSVLVILDSDHSKTHVLNELEVYSQFVTPGSYIVAFDGSMEYIHETPTSKAMDIDWETDNPAAAAREFLESHPSFTYDTHYARLGITYCHDGFLRRTRSRIPIRVENAFWTKLRVTYHEIVPLKWRIRLRDIRKQLRS